MAALKDKRHERFCQEYVIDYNGTRAAIRAGYSEKNAATQSGRMLRKAEVLARVRELQGEQVARLSVTQDYVVLQLLDTYAKCSKPVPVMQYDPDAGGMVESGEYQFDSKGALRALELIGKHLGMYNDKLQVTAQVNTGQLDNVLAQLRGGQDG